MNTFRLALILVVAVCHTACAQIEILPQSAFPQSYSPAPKAAKAEQIVTNGEITGLKPFTLLVIGDSAAAPGLHQMLARPQTQQLANWVGNCEVRWMGIDDPNVREHHMDLVRKHQELPILALVDTKGMSSQGGGVWWSVSGSSIPQSELQLAAALNEYYGATQKAKQQQGVQSTQPAQNYYIPNNYTIPYANNGPSPFRPNNNNRQPLFNPQIDHNLNIPSNVGAHAEVSLDADTRRALYFGGAILLLCTVIVSVGLLMASTIIGNAITDDDDDKDLFGQIRSVLPSQFVPQQFSQQASPTQQVTA